MTNSAALWESEDEVGAFAARTREFAELDEATAQDDSVTAQVERAEREVRRLEALRFGGVDHADLPAALARLAILSAQAVAESDARFAADWTADATSARRAAWNDGIRAIAKGGKVAAQDLAQLEQRLGYGLAQIKRAKDIHGVA